MKILTLILLIPCLYNAVITEQILSIIIIALLCAIVIVDEKFKNLIVKSTLILIVVSSIAWSSTDLHFSKFVLAFSLSLFVILHLLSFSRFYFQDYKKTILILSGLFFIVQSSNFPGLVFFKTNNKIASWDRTKWCNVYDYDDSITIKSQYSYDFFRKLINAESLTNTINLDNYSSLWILTPTELLTSDEIKDIRNWVLKGGRLIIVTDHTDIYGHARNLSPLVKCFKMSINKDNIIDQKNVGGTYWLNYKVLSGLSPNSFRGSGEAWLTTLGYSERADFGGTNFFSDGQISDEEDYSLWTIGLKKSFGLGTVTLFGDSTMFSNFGITRPSSQYLLSKIFNDVSPFPYNALAAFGVFLFLLSRSTNKTEKVLYFIFIILSLVIMLLPICHNNHALHFDKFQTISVSGDWNLVEPISENHPPAFRTFFAASYIASPKFPVWLGSNDKSNLLKFSNGKCLLGETPEHEHYSGKQELYKILQLRKSMSLENCIDEINKYAYASTFWFDSGIGPLNEYAYRKFWNDITGSSEKMKPYPILSNPTNVFYYVYTTNGYQQLSLEIRDINNKSGWKLIGDFVVAKENNKGNLIIRKLWQKHQWQYNDMMLYKKYPSSN